MTRPDGNKVIAGLSFQFGLLMSVILVISMIITTWLSYRDNNRITEETLATRLQSIGHLMAAISIEPLLVYDLVTLSDHIKTTLQEKDVVFVQLFDAEGRPIQRQYNPDSRLAKRIMQVVQTNNRSQFFALIESDPDIISMRFPIDLEGQPLGAVMIGLDRRDYDLAASSRFRKNILLILALAGFAGFSIYLIFNHRILRPINRLKQAASRVANFELDQRVTIHGHNELSNLASSFNDMTGHLAEAVESRNRSLKELRQLNETLEERIHERTQELQQLNRKVSHQAMHDPLTGLPNRTLIMERLKQAIRYARRHQKTVAVFMLDLNRFKEVNDTLGHPVGDKVLKEVSQRLPRVVSRETDTVGRLGGDEFVIILSESSLEHAKLVADKIQQEFINDFKIDGHQLPVDTSIGVAMYPEHSDDPDSLIQKADIALYVAKRKHDAHIAIYDEADDHHTLSKLLLVSDLKEAIEKDELELFFQPQVHLETGLVCGLEALCRWHHPQQGFISPEVFIPMAEDSGLIKPLTDAVLNSAIRHAAEWRAKGLTIRIAVNLSIGNLLDPDLPARFAAQLNEYQLDASLIKLEITESMIMSDPDRVIETLLDPVFANVQVSIDDFGTGYSSLNHLKRLPVNEIKVDRSFVADMYSDADDASIVQSIISLASSMNLSVVAEGVEDHETARQLLRMGCHNGQGYLYSKPVCADDVLDTVRRIDSSEYLASGEVVSNSFVRA